MANETKTKLVSWIKFGISALSIIGNLVLEIIKEIPTKGE